MDDAEIAAENRVRTKMDERFFTVKQGREGVKLAGERMDTIHSMVVGLATYIEMHVPAGRNKSIALTALEDVQIRSIRGLFE